MIKRFANTGLGAVFAFCVFAGSGQADTTLQFTSIGTSCNSGTGGCGTAVTAVGNTISALDILDFTTLKVLEGATTVETWTLTASELKNNGGVNNFALSFTATCASGLCGSRSFSGTNLLSFTTTAAPGYSGTLVYGIAIGAPTSLTETATLLEELSLSAPTGTLGPSPTSGSATTTGTGTVGSTFDLNNSATLNLEASTQVISPEPVSFLLFGTGLLAVALVARQRRQRTTAPQKI